MSTQFLSFSLIDDFNNVTSSNKSFINYENIRKYILNTVLNDFDKLSFNTIENVFEISFENKLTTLTPTEINNITTFINNYNPDTLEEVIDIVSNDPLKSCKYKSILDALANNKKNILLKSSLNPYTIDNDILLTNGVQIIGENKNDVIIDMDGNSFGNEMETYSFSGSITFTQNSSTVTGVGTSFISAFSHIEYNSTLYEIASVESSTSLTLVNPYLNNTITISSSNFLISSFYKNIVLKNITIRNFSSSSFNQLLNGIFENVTFEGNASIDFNVCYNLNLKGCFMKNLKINDTKRSDINGCMIGGLEIFSTNYKACEIKINNSVFENSYKGIVIGDSSTLSKNYVNNIVMNGCTIKNNRENGVEVNNYYTGGNNLVYNIFIKGCDITHNLGDGIVIKGELVNIENSVVKNNTRNGIVMNNKNISVMGNIISNNTENGIKIISNDNASLKNEYIIIKNNIVRSNGMNGIYSIDNNISNVTISSCEMIDNVLKGIYIEPASTTTFACNRFIISNNNLNGDLFIGGKTAASSKVQNCITSNNILKEIVLSTKTEKLLFKNNLYEGITNPVALNLNLLDALGLNFIL